MAFFIQTALFSAIISFVIAKIVVERSMRVSRRQSLSFAKDKLKLIDQKIAFIEEKRSENPSLFQSILNDSGSHDSFAEYQALKKDFSNPDYDADNANYLRQEYFFLCNERQILSEEVRFLSSAYVVRPFEI